MKHELSAIFYMLDFGLVKIYWTLKIVDLQYVLDQKLEGSNLPERTFDFPGVLMSLGSAMQSIVRLVVSLTVVWSL